MKRKKLLAKRANYGNKRKKKQVKYLIYHFTANDGDHDESNARYFHTRVVKASAHEFVDDDSYTISVPGNYTAYAVGGNKYTDCGSTGGGKMYGKITNANSYSIELCDTLPNGKVKASELTLENAAARGRALMKKYHIAASNVFRHFDVNGKHCPAYFMDNAKWNRFKQRLKKGKRPLKTVSAKSNPVYLIWVARKMNAKFGWTVPDDGEWSPQMTKAVISCYKKYYPGKKVTGIRVGPGLISKLAK